MPEQTTDSQSAAAPRPRSLRPAKASACGKAILVGEHAVVYGARAVAMPLREMRMKVDLHGDHPGGDLAHVNLRLGDKEVSPRIGGVVTDALELLGAPGRGATIHGRSSIPFGAGLGSSATLCIVILRALAAGLGRDLSREELARMGTILERRFHGNPSGLDTAVVAFEECIVFAKGQSVRPVPVRRTSDDQAFWPFVLIDSAVRASTLAMIHIAAPYFQSSKGDERLARFDALAEAMMKGLDAHDVAAVAEVMSEASTLLDACGVVTSQLHGLMTTVRQCGVLAVKPTGAGGGGSILALLDPARAAEQRERLITTFGNDRVFPVSL